MAAPTRCDAAAASRHAGSSAVHILRRAAAGGSGRRWQLMRPVVIVSRRNVRISRACGGRGRGRGLRRASSGFFFGGQCWEAVSAERVRSAATRPSFSRCSLEPGHVRCNGFALCNGITGCSLEPPGLVQDRRFFLRLVLRRSHAEWLSRPSARVPLHLEQIVARSSAAAAARPHCPSAAAAESYGATEFWGRPGSRLIPSSEEAPAAARAAAALPRVGFRRASRPVGQSPRVTWCVMVCRSVSS